MDGAPAAAFGTFRNDWAGTLGEYEFNTWGGAYSQSTSPWGNNPILAGDYQNNMIPSLTRPLLTPTSDSNINFSQPLFYYFGLRPGQTAFNTFVRKYVDEELANSVL